MDVFIRNKPYTGPIQAVVLDWAGTTVDFGCVGPVAVFIEAFARYGVKVAASEARGPMGLAKVDHVRALCRLPSVSTQWCELCGREPDEDDVQRIYRDTEPLMVSSIAGHADLVPGLLPAIDAFKRNGIKIGTSTGYTKPMMDILLPEAMKRGYRPDSVVCSSDVPKGRPFPFMCYQNAINLEVYPMEAMVKIGDTVKDIEEGLNAGMWVVGITRSGNDLGLTESEVSSLPGDELQGRLAAIETRFIDAGAHFVAEDISQCPEIVEEINGCLIHGEVP